MNIQIQNELLNAGIEFDKNSDYVFIKKEETLLSRDIKVDHCYTILINEVNYNVDVINIKQHEILLNGVDEYGKSFYAWVNKSNIKVVCEI